MLGCSNIWWVPLGNTYGRRPVIVANLLLSFVFSIWCANAKSYNSLLAARVFQGAAGGAADTLAATVVGEVFFVHQRGRALAIYTIFLVAGSLVGGVVGGYITASLGWRWTCWIPAISFGVLFVLSVLLLPETMFNREAAMGVVHRGRVEDQDIESEKEKAQMNQLERVNSQVYPPYTFARSMGFCKPRPGLLKRFYTPYITLLWPGTIVVLLNYGGLVGLIVTASSLAPQILSAPPYLWGGSAGLINIGGLIGTILGCAYTYFTADWIIKRAAKRESHGHSEPEQRLPLTFPALFIATAGALVFGFVAQNPSRLGWVGLNAGLAMVTFGLMQVPSVGFNYLIEAYGDWASDCCKFKPSNPFFYPLLNIMTDFSIQSS